MAFSLDELRALGREVFDTPARRTMFVEQFEATTRRRFCEGCPGKWGGYLKDLIHHLETQEMKAQDETKSKAIDTAAAEVAAAIVDAIGRNAEAKLPTPPADKLRDMVKPGYHHTPDGIVSVESSDALLAIAWEWHPWCFDIKSES